MPDNTQSMEDRFDKFMNERRDSRLNDTYNQLKFFITSERELWKREVMEYVDEQKSKDTWNVDYVYVEQLKEFITSLK